MSIPKKPIKNARNLFRQIQKPSQAALKGFVNWVLRMLLRTGKRPNLAKAGFALPTVMMVTLVVALLTTTMVLRSFDRNRNAINARSEQVIQNSSTPAIDRAKAKLAALFADPKVPRGTPSDDTLFDVMEAEKYTFGDETRLKLALNFGDGTIPTQQRPSRNGKIDTTTDARSNETLDTAWKYPIDTDGNGKFDAFTLYGIYFRNPPVKPGTNEYVDGGRIPLESRSIPQDTSVASACAAQGQTAATSIGSEGWFQQGSTQSKAFYAYAATVPISDINDPNFSPGPFDRAKFESNKKKDRAFSGLEYQQDKYRSGLNNTSVWYQNDLVINPGSTLRLNGRVFTNGNLLVGGLPGYGNIEFYQVSSKYSCFYDSINAKIQVGGNVGTADVPFDADRQPGSVHLFKGKNVEPDKTPLINAANRSTTSPGGNLVAYNDAAYNQRIALMRDTALSLCAGCDATTDPSNPLATRASVLATPQYMADSDLKEKLVGTEGTTGKLTKAPENPSENYKILWDEIETYLRNRTRRVPYAEVPEPDGSTALTAYPAINKYPPTNKKDNINASVFTTGIEPPAVWREPTDANTQLALNTGNLPQNNPDNKKLPTSTEDLLGDRVNVGNNLPALWKNNGKYQSTDKQDISGASWADGGTRYRTTQAKALEDVGASDRDGYWEKAAVANPNASKDYFGGGGLRVITGAGVYVDDREILPDQTINTTGGYYKSATRSFLPTPSWDLKFVDPNITNPDPTKVHPADLQFKTQNPIIVWSDLMPMTGVKGDKRNGDLLMRATAVYHYVNSPEVDPPSPTQAPLACVSSYYDPTNEVTARNPLNFPDVSGGVDSNGDGYIDELFGGGTPGTRIVYPGKVSNNGVVYNYPGASFRDNYRPRLIRQARLVFPNGRVVNPALRQAMSKTPAQRTLADYSAIDAAVCAMAILDNNSSPTPIIPDGAIKESTFLDGREVKATDKLRPSDPNYTSIDNNYDLPLDQRQPLEVRVTDINVGLLASTGYGTFTTKDKTVDEYLLPNSGIIFASRDDALPDSSGKDASLSATDFRLDPTRRPNGIRLTNGLRIARGAGNTYRVEEKGLILATNTPAYVKGHFNLHLPSGKTALAAGDQELEEFNEALNAADWSTNFYTRGAGGLTTFNAQFACRDGQPKCTSPGDQWRPATIIADAITLQSTRYQDGYRSQGDFDLRNNSGTVLAGKRASQGFFDNNFVTTANWAGADGFPQDTSKVSYLLNGVTPIQRRATVHAYKTEFCSKIPVSDCTPADWKEKPRPSDPVTAIVDTSQPPGLNQIRYARRVAFKKEKDTITNPTKPEFRYYYDEQGYPMLNRPKSASPQDNALWFETRNTNNGNPSFNGGAALTSEPFIYRPPTNEVPDLGWLRGYAAISPNNYAILADPPTPLDPATFPPITPDKLLPSPPAAHNAAAITTQLNDTYTAFTALPTASQPANLLQLVAPTTYPRPKDKTTEITGGGKRVIYNSSGNLLLNPTKKITLSGDASSVFIFIIPNDLSVQQGSPGQTSVDLGNVLPENVYWIVGNNIKVGANTTLPGNVLARGTITIGKRASLEGRALSSTEVVFTPANPANMGKILAPRGNQPRLVPVTQIQSVDGVPSTGTQPAIGLVDNYPSTWLQQATSTNYNIAFVVGDSPSRPQEPSAGLPNLVRLQENWNAQNLTIKGSFIQQKRSTYATGPFAPIRANGASPKIGADDGSLSTFGYESTQYSTKNGNGAQPNYQPPVRQWGFDVGLLSQPPDLFSSKFTQDISKSQGYYRQVGRDDQWIQTLLCAAEPADPTDDDQRVGNAASNPIQYTRPAVPSATERPNCQQVINAGWSGSTPNYPATQ